MKRTTLDDEIDAILALNREAAKIAKEADKKFGALKRKLRQGKTTGDPVRDVEIRCWSSLSRGLYRALKKVRSRFSADNAVLIVEEEERPFIHYLGGIAHHSSCEGLIPPEDHSTITEYHLKLAVLTRPASYDPVDGALHLPADAYAETRTPTQPENWERKQGFLEIPKFELIGLIQKVMGTPVEEDRFLAAQMGRMPLSTKIFVGDEVVQYFSKAPYLHLSPDRGYLHAMRLLGQPLPEDIAMKLFP